MKERTMRMGMLAYLGAAVLACLGLPGCIYYLNPLCTDQIRNGDETGVDCGGSCGRCNIGESCSKDADCDENNCARGTCKAIPCENGILDAGETDVDCGGGTCRKCSGGRKCRVDADCFSGTCLPGSNTCSSLTTMAFADAVSYPSGGKAYALFSGDLNGDGLVDLAVANEIDSQILVFVNDGRGAFQRMPAAFPTGDFPTGGTLADFNHDGVPDVITANFHGNSVSILFGTGTGALGASTSYPTVDGGETSNLAVGDLNHDGNLDVIATNQSESSVSQFMGRADGTLAPSITVPVGKSGASVPFSAAIGDFNRDGNNDVAIADDLSSTMIVRLGNGDGTLQDEVSYDLHGTRDFVVITADLNLDGKLDLVTANRGSSSVSVLLGRGDGTFQAAIVSPTGDGIGPYSLAVADFNLDGVPDVVTANFMSDNATVLLGIGNGHFEAPINAGATGNFCYGVAAGDFNGDGKPDFATANALSNTMTVKLSTSH